MQQNPTLRTGSTLKGGKFAYTIQSVLGQGSFGITYLATTNAVVSGPLGNIETEIKVAIKEFFMKEFSNRHEDGSITEMTGGSLVHSYAIKFRKEAENLAKLSHPNIVNVLEVFEANNTCYYAMQYLAGGSLDAYVKSRGGLPEAEAVACIRQIGAAVQYMHDHRMLHLDLKPGNVMRSEDGQKMVLIDFGLSKQYGKDGNPESSTTIGLGTAGYAPIEQSKSDRDKEFAPTLDVYALGATFFKLLTATTPPDSSDVLDEGLPIDLLENKGVSQTSIVAIERAMEPRKSKRVQSVTEFLGLLVPSAADEGSDEGTRIDDEEPTVPITPQQPQQPQPQPRKPQPKWLWPVVGCVAIVAVAVGMNHMTSGPSDGESTYEQTYEKVTPQEFTVGDVSFTMLPVEGGTFTMGATAEMTDPFDDEKPTHQVTLSSYFMGETEVTQALWTAVMGSNPSGFKGDDLPVEWVSWNDFQAFLTKLNALTGRTFRLPTEAEWEYAARGGSKSGGTQYSGSSNLDEVAWYGDNSGDKTHPVKTKKANELGLYDMSGNVFEWCQDWYGSYSSSAQTNPTGPSSGSGRVARGGSWYFPACCSSYRLNIPPGDRYSYLGFRLVLSE